MVPTFYPQSIGKFIFERWRALMKRFVDLDRICYDPLCVNRECVEARHERQLRHGVTIEIIKPTKD